MFRRVSAASATSAVAVRMSSTADAPRVGAFGFMLAKVDYHAEARTQKYVSKIAFNPYAAGFMEALEQKSAAASLSKSDCVQNHFQTYQHQGCSIMSDNVFCQ